MHDPGLRRKPRPPVESRGRMRARMTRRLGPVLFATALGVILGVGTLVVLGGDEEPFPQTAAPSTAVTPETTTPLPPTTTITMPSTTTSTSVPPTTTTTVPVRSIGVVPGSTVGEPWGSTSGLTMFRGSPTRTHYGAGPLSDSPGLAWRYPESPMCSTSSVGGEIKVWCGTGWTGQPAVWVRPDGITEVVFGAYDGSVHFVDAVTGEALRPAYRTGDIIKGSVTIDPDGFPLLYFGSRDNKLRVVALDRGVPELLWSLDASEVRGIWNNDWDGNPVVIDDVLYEGGENGWFFAYQLNRGFDSEGLAAVDPIRLFAMPGYTDELIQASGRNVSIESSVVAYEETVYFANSGGRVVGLDVSDIRNGNAPVVFDYYAGGDIDATMIVDSEGFLYVSIEHEPSQMNWIELARNREVGQLVKLDPYAEGDPRVWGIDLTDGSSDTGIWATPALLEGMLYVNTHNGDLIAVDTTTGRITWSDPVGWHSWSSPSPVDGTLIVATCLGEIRGYSLADPQEPERIWTIDDLGGACLESTPAIWNGTIFLGSRDGYMRAFR